MDPMLISHCYRPDRDHTHDPPRLLASEALRGAPTAYISVGLPPYAGVSVPWPGTIQIDNAGTVVYRVAVGEARAL